ncbi:BPTD_3080 family restriction endonuclease [Anaerovibrio sp.]|uniref:BPTD_3080 family restriction endonuclease n=1 Tax=Anaerovibrio sp. TaxID=1872532 RepID=UPI0038911518
MPKVIDKLIINSPYEEPKHHWRYDIETQMFEQEPGRRPAGYFVAGEGGNEYNDIGRFIELPMVNRIRPRVKAWREAGFPGVTGITRKLLNHWHDAEARQHQFFFCQLDAIETIIWFAEAPASDRVGINIEGDGGEFRRLCTKLCTGGGKTIVMAMLIAWQVCNKVTYPQDKRFSKNVFIVAPGLTVKSRLQVLKTGGQDNYYSQFCVVPNTMLDKLNQGTIVVTNWQDMETESEEALKKKKSVDKRGPLSDEAFSRKVLGELATAHNILVINDEAHHAWRKNPEIKIKIEGNREEKAAAKEYENEATVWIRGLDRINKTRNILCCYDFSATPFAPSGKKNDEEALFSWIISDFGLNDGIEAGLVKTPRIVVRDDGTLNTKNMKSKLYHIYRDEEVYDDITRDADKTEPLPTLLRNAYYLLGRDWQETYKEWENAGSKVPPVMITVANRTETAARIQYAFEHERIPIPELCEKSKVVRIDSKVLKSTADVKEIDLGSVDLSDTSVDNIAAYLRQMIDTTGQVGEPGEQLRNIISVGMLSEGWDAKTVTHIMGLRAFSSQLLCEQVVGRGLRRTSYDVDEETGLFKAEYVNIFGIPFSYLPHEGGDDGGKEKPEKPKTRIEALRDKKEYEISWPNIVRINREFRQKLSVDMSKIPQLRIDASEVRLAAQLAPVVDGKTDLSKCIDIDLEKLDDVLRLQSIIFKEAAEVYEQMAKETVWAKEGTAYGLFGQVVALVREFWDAGKFSVYPMSFSNNELRKKIAAMLSMSKIVNHVWKYIEQEQTEKCIPIFDQGKKICSTGDMQVWFTTKPCNLTRKSHISHCVYDSSWESSTAYELERNDHVVAWAKNDHLGFYVNYNFAGQYHKYVPDYLIKLDNGHMLVLEVKGKESERDKVKRQYLQEWIEAVNSTGEFGIWHSDCIYGIKDSTDTIAKYL